MAEPSQRLAEWWRPYGTILRARMRAQLAYRTSFAVDVFGTVLVGLVELAETYTLFHAVPALGGLTFNQILLVFALSNIAFSLGDMFFGHLDNLPTYIRAGTVDAFYLRPLPLLAQLMTSEISLRRFGRLSVAIVCLVAALTINPIELTLSHVALLALTLACGFAIFGALFTAAAGLQFFLIDGAEFTNSFTYGGSYAAQQPQRVFPDPLRIFWTFVIHTAFIGYLPALAILDLPGPPFTPAWLAWCSPIAAVAVWAAALGLWRVGTRHYQGAGG